MLSHINIGLQEISSLSNQQTDEIPFRYLKMRHSVNLNTFEPLADGFYISISVSRSRLETDSSMAIMIKCSHSALVYTVKKPSTLSFLEFFN